MVAISLAILEEEFTGNTANVSKAMYEKVNKVGYTKRRELLEFRIEN